MRMTRSLIGIGLLALLTPLLQAGAQEVQGRAGERLRAEIARWEKASGGSIGVAAVHIESGRAVAWNPEIRYPMASTFKIPVAVGLLSRVDAGEIGLADMIAVGTTDIHPGSGTISKQLNKPGLTMSLDNLLELMLLVSDNTAADLCLEAAGGPESVTRTMRGLGIAGLDVSRPTFVSLANSLGITIFDHGGPYAEAEAVRAISRLTGETRATAWKAFLDDSRDTSTPEAMVRLLKKIWTREALGDESAARLLDVMRRCRTGKDRIRAFLPPDTVVFDKTGTIQKVFNDVGIIELPDGGGHVAAAVFLKDVRLEEDASERTIAHIARALYDYFLFGGSE